MNWIQGLLEEISSIDISKPAKGKKFNPETDQEIGVLSDDLKRFNRLLDARIEIIEDLILRMEDHIELHRVGEEYNLKTCLAHQEKILPLKQKLESLHKELDLLKQLFFVEVQHQFGEALKGKSIGIIEGDIVIIKKKDENNLAGALIFAICKGMETHITLLQEEVLSGGGPKPSDN